MYSYFVGKKSLKNLETTHMKKIILMTAFIFSVFFTSECTRRNISDNSFY